MCLGEEEETEEAVEAREEEEEGEEEKREEGDRASPLHSHSESPPWSHPPPHAARFPALRTRHYCSLGLLGPVRNRGSGT